MIESDVEELQQKVVRLETVVRSLFEIIRDQHHVKPACPLADEHTTGSACFVCGKQKAAGHTHTKQDSALAAPYCIACKRLLVNGHCPNCCRGCE